MQTDVVRATGEGLGNSAYQVDLGHGSAALVEHGQPAMAAASLLCRGGHRDVAVTTAGPDQLTTWSRP
jgi:hypothetical protein